MCFPGGSDGKESACERKRPGFDSLDQKDSQEKEIATHPSILAWRIPWTEEPGGLQSMGMLRVGRLTVTLQEGSCLWVWTLHWLVETL